MLSVTISRDARARAVQLPAWNEALGLPRAWDQQWSLRAQQILAHETDLLEYDDIFEGSHVVEDLTARIEAEAWEELCRVLDLGGSLTALGYMKGRLVERLAERLRRIESGDQVVVGVNRLQETETSGLVEAVGSGMAAVERVEQKTEEEQIERLRAWREERDSSTVHKALDAVRTAAAGRENLVTVSIEAARAGVTTGEWADSLREVFGEFRPPTGLSNGRVAVPAGDASAIQRVRTKVALAADRLGVSKVRVLVGKPGLDGHSNAAEQVALRARDAGFEVIYQGIRLTPEEIARAAADEDVHVVALSILSGAHLILVPAVLDRLRAEGIKSERVPVVVGGAIPEQDASRLRALGVARVFTPEDHDLTAAIGEIADLLR
jgi:(2R)-ethylmalonyl-CoA mutase